MVTSHRSLRTADLSSGVECETVLCFVRHVLGLQDTACCAQLRSVDIERSGNRFRAGGGIFPLLTVSLHSASRMSKLARPVFSHVGTAHLVTVLAPLVVLLVQLLWLSPRQLLSSRRAVLPPCSTTTVARAWPLAGTCDILVRTFGKLTLGTTTVLAALGASLGSADLSPPG